VLRRERIRPSFSAVHGGAQCAPESGNLQTPISGFSGNHSSPSPRSISRSADERARSRAIQRPTGWLDSSIRAVQLHLLPPGNAQGGTSRGSGEVDACVKTPHELVFDVGKAGSSAPAILAAGRQLICEWNVVGEDPRSELGPGGGAVEFSCPRRLGR